MPINIPKSRYQVLIDEIFNYVDHLKISSFCSVKICYRCSVKICYRMDTGEMIAILTELKSNPGTCISHVLDELCTMIFDRYMNNKSPMSIIWIEHYPADLNPDNKDSYTLVKFNSFMNDRYNSWESRLLTQEEMDRYIHGK